VGSRSGPASIAIVARRVGERLTLSVEDDGGGAESPEIQRGIGLTNTTARLTELYGDRHAFTLGPRPEGGFQVTIELPFRET
jgi:two-component system, LytTR family, sensor kinase